MSELTTIAINGINLQVVAEKAQYIKEFKVGEPVKVLVKKYSDTWENFTGMIIGFDFFENRPTINVAYLENSYSEVSIKVVSIHRDTKDIEIAHLNQVELKLNKENIISKFDENIRKLKQQIENIETQKDIFYSTFGTTFKFEG